MQTAKPKKKKKKKRALDNESAQYDLNDQMFRTSDFNGFMSKDNIQPKGRLGKLQYIHTSDNSWDQGDDIMI